MKQLLLLAFFAVALPAQVVSDFYPQATKVGTLRKYVVHSCNTGPAAVVAMGADIWREAKKQGVNPQEPSTVLTEQTRVTGSSKKQKALYIITGASAVVLTLSTTKVIKLDPNTPGGKLYYSSLAAATVGLPLLATQIDKVKEPTVDLELGSFLPGRIPLNAGECGRFVIFGL